MPKKFYVTTPIYYPSGKPHIGTTYTTVLADIFARWHKMLGEDVYFTTGTDEHGKKILDCAKEANQSPKKYVDEMSVHFKESFEAYNLSFDKFVRTTDPKHKKFCQGIIQKLYDKGDIYKGKYEGWYCVSCETYYTDKDLVDNKCPLHHKKVEWMEEETYLFKMSKYQNKVMDYIKKQDYIFPKSRQKYLINRMKEGVNDLSVSRANLDWGVQFPFDKKHVAYVWTDALWNYVTSTETESKIKFWPADIHITAHDIMWHHSVIWLSLLFAAGVKPPKKLLVHGFINADGGIKMSKSLGNVIDPMELIKTYPVDTIRYFLVREIPLGSDGTFSMAALNARHNNELVNDLGNLHSRTLTMIDKYFQGKIPRSSKNELVKKLHFKKINFYMEKYETHNALAEIWKFINECNKYINTNRPWELATSNPKKLETILYNLAESLRYLSIVLEPFIPETTEKIKKSLGLKKKETFKDLKFGLLGNNQVKKEGYLFIRIEEEKKMEKKSHKTTAGTPISTPEAGHYIPFKEWEKMKLRIGVIKKIQPHPDADRLYIMMVDLGEGETDRQIVAGLKEHYKPEELLNKEVVIFTNLQPTIIRGVESNGMVLVAEFEGKVSVLTPEKKMHPGAQIR